MQRPEIGEQLAAYLADELPADERAALEAQLARDAGLRARLERIRRADAALADLPRVAPPPAFSAHLREQLAEELRRTDGPGDELAARRAARQRRLAGAGAIAAAAAVALIGVITIGGGMLGGDSDDAASGDDQPATAALEAPAALDLVRVTDREYDAESVDRLRDGAVIDPTSLESLSPAEAEDLARTGTRALGYSHAEAATLQRDSADVSAAAPAEGSDGVASDGTAEDAASADQAQAESAGPQDDARRCAEQILASADTLIPLLAEVARFDGEPAILYLFASRSPDDGRFSRLEVWAVARADCAVLHFAQFDR